MVDGAQALAVLAARARSRARRPRRRCIRWKRCSIVGELLNLTVSGLYQMLEMRAQLKNELRIEDRTMIASRENNPLKHSDSARDALRYLVDVRQHGNKLFLQPAKAIGDAVSDVCAHEVAVMAGTRAALLAAALKMFSPEVVEKRIKKSGALDSVMPALHKAKLWESFLCRCTASWRRRPRITSTACSTRSSRAPTRSRARSCGARSEPIGECS